MKVSTFCRAANPFASFFGGGAIIQEEDEGEVQARIAAEAAEQEYVPCPLRTHPIRFLAFIAKLGYHCRDHCRELIRSVISPLMTCIVTCRRLVAEARMREEQAAAEQAAAARAAAAAAKPAVSNPFGCVANWRVA